MPNALRDAVDPKSLQRRPWEYLDTFSGLVTR
jgi:hypothetical protein